MCDHLSETKKSRLTYKQTYITMNMANYKNRPLLNRNWLITAKVDDCMYFVLNRNAKHTNDT